MWWREFLFTFFYAGYIPIAPGTAGTLAAMGIYILEYQIFGSKSWIANLIIVIVFIYPAIRLGDAGEELFGKKDPPEVVLDEAMGYWISVLFYPFNLKIALLAFFIFRIMDILKPYPANRSQKLPGGLGIMLDDYIAGIYTNVIVLVTVLIAYYCGYSFY